jgi:hypothetical protein
MHVAACTSQQEFPGLLMPVSHDAAKEILPGFSCLAIEILLPPWA